MPRNFPQPSTTRTAVVDASGVVVVILRGTHTEPKALRAAGVR